VSKNIPAGADDATQARQAGFDAPTGSPEDYRRSGRLRTSVYEAEMKRLQEQLVLLQYWIQTQGLKVLVIFEGRGSAGKGGVIKRITERTSPRTVRVVALPKPNERERTQWYFQRYVEHLPAAGEMVLFDRSWYNRSNVEWVMDYCAEDEHAEFALLPGVRADAGALGDRAAEVLVLGVVRGAAQALRGPQRRAAQAVEALRHGPR